ncbi:MAG: DUF4230 domain-containing protein [Planctomycetota bacterium]
MLLSPMDIVLLSALPIAAIAACALGFVWAGKRAARRFENRAETHVVAERVRAVGKLVGLEVAAKEIATATSGVSWLPPMVLSQARLAMIFHFERQYAVDMGAVRERDVRRLGQGRYELTLPEVAGDVRLTDVTPYDVQDGRVLGLLDVIPMTADRQKSLMRRAQEQAAAHYAAGDDRYREAARSSIERQLSGLFRLLGVSVTLRWRDGDAGDAPVGVIEHGGEVRTPGAVAASA